MRLLRLGLSLLLFATPFGASAKTDWSKTKLDPAKAYVLVQLEPVEFKMMGNNAIATGLILSAYDADKAMIQMVEKNGKVVGVQRLNLSDAAIAKVGKRKQYFSAITPGVWVIEGAGGGGGTLGAAMTSFSLGSYKFEARAGEVIDLGVIAPSREESDNPDTKMSGGKMVGMMMGGMFGGGRVEPLPLKLAFRPRGSGDLALPAWLSAAPLIQPGFTYGVTFPNLLGGLVNRVDGKAGRGRVAGEVVYLSKSGMTQTSPSPVLQP
jgi:hypothetical protein